MMNKKIFKKYPGFVRHKSKAELFYSAMRLDDES